MTNTILISNAMAPLLRHKCKPEAENRRHNLGWETSIIQGLAWPPTEKRVGIQRTVRCAAASTPKPYKGFLIATLLERYLCFPSGLI